MKKFILLFVGLCIMASISVVFYRPREDTSNVPEDIVERQKLEYFEQNREIDRF